jgi:hypothetical protein
VVLEVDMQPLASRVASFSCTDSEHCRSDSLVPIRVCDHGIQNECMQRSVPCNIDKPDEIVRVLRADPSKAVTILAPTSHHEETMLKTVGVQPIHRRIAEFIAPNVLNVYSWGYRSSICATRPRTRSSTCRDARSNGAPTRVSPQTQQMHYDCDSSRSRAAPQILTSSHSKRATALP